MEEKTIDLSKIKNLIKPATMPIMMPVNFYKYENRTTITSLSKAIEENRDENLFNGLSCSWNETDDCFIADLVGVSNKSK